MILLRIRLSNSRGTIAALAVPAKRDTRSDPTRSEERKIESGELSLNGLDPYMDAPTLPSVSLSVLVSQDEIAAIHSACVCDAKSRPALMEYAG
jgi:hypothetical protein